MTSPKTFPVKIRDEFGFSASKIKELWKKTKGMYSPLILLSNTSKKDSLHIKSSKYNKNVQENNSSEEEEGYVCETPGEVPSIDENHCSNPSKKINVNAEIPSNLGNKNELQNQKNLPSNSRANLQIPIMIKQENPY